MTYLSSFSVTANRWGGGGRGIISIGGIGCGVGEYIQMDQERIELLDFVVTVMGPQDFH
jgi:hypothetical protein